MSAKHNPYALKFNKSNNGVRLPSGYYVLENDFTREFWVKKQDYTRAILIGGYQVSGLNNTNIELTADNRIRVFWNDDDLFYTTTKLDVDKWYHVAWVRDTAAKEQRIYINGESDYVHPNAGVNIKYGGGREWVGRDNRTGTTVLNGYMDELRDWNIVRTEEQIKTYMNKKISSNSKGLVGYWCFDEGIGAKTYSKNGLIADITGAQWAPGEIDLSLFTSLFVVSDDKRHYSYDGSTGGWIQLGTEVSVQDYNEKGVYDFSELNKELIKTLPNLKTDKPILKTFKFN